MKKKQHNDPTASSLNYSSPTAETQSSRTMILKENHMVQTVAFFLFAMCICVAGTLLADETADADKQAGIDSQSKAASADAVPTDWAKAPVFSNQKTNLTQPVELWTPSRGWKPSANWPPKNPTVKKRITISKPASQKKPTDGKKDAEDKKALVPSSNVAPAKQLKETEVVIQPVQGKAKTKAPLPVSNPTNVRPEPPTLASATSATAGPGSASVIPATDNGTRVETADVKSKVQLNPLSTKQVGFTVYPPEGFAAIQTNPLFKGDRQAAQDSPLAITTPVMPLESGQANDRPTLQRSPAPVLRPSDTTKSATFANQPSRSPITQVNPLADVPSAKFPAGALAEALKYEAEQAEQEDGWSPNTLVAPKQNVRTAAQPKKQSSAKGTPAKFASTKQEATAPAPLKDAPKQTESQTKEEQTAGEEKLPQPFKQQPFDKALGQPKNYHAADFSPTPVDGPAMHFDANREAWVYDAKQEVPTQHPWIEYPREWYGNGITPKGFNWFGYKNLARPKFYMYGDYRAGIQGGRNAAGRADNFANRLNLDLDLQITDTERFHTFVGPLDEGGRFTRVELNDGDLDYRQEIDFTPATGFFEGDLGVMLGNVRNRTSPFELPFTAGLVPLLFQNGIWMEDAVTGFAFALPSKHSRLFNISNMDLTFFAVFDQLNSPAFARDSDAQAFGTAWFIEVLDGYIETGYAYLNDRNNDARDYHNATFSFSRRYFDRISNSVRVIVNTGQDGDRDSRTADGGILLVENSWITAKPLTVVPYANFFYGWDRPQSVARAGGSGGLLRSTGINFQSDGLNGFAFLDDTGVDTAGGAIGVDLIGDQLDRQLIIEAAYQSPHGNKNPNVPDDQFAVGARAQFNLTNWTLIRMDAMHGWRRGLDDIYGTRVEWRWKF